MELRHLRYFVRVAEERHFGRAAADLGISQPPLSQQIRALEEELGVPLLERTSRRVELTEAGRLFLPEARATLAQAAHAADVARRALAGEIGTLAVAFSSSVPFVPVVGRALAGFRRDHPAIHLTLAELPRDDQFDQLATRAIDLGFVRGFEPLPLPPLLSAILIGEEPLLVAIPTDHALAQEDRPLGAADLAGLPVVQYQAAAGAGFTDHLSAIFRRRGLDLHVAQEVGGLASLIGLVAAGIGIALLPRSLGTLKADGLTWRPFDEPGALSRLWLVHHQQWPKTARLFAALLSAGAEQDE
ncbi:LysR family transcriptional regulator [Sphingomonas jatrophae]|uniref:Transcriptional regulator, LysR family n=1 Tax=Sphingomonas jatrophae TaxID=1166337 RepID=A0A1I6JTI9_9SPHN|nr:LysR substrate-binding domain-containing protein [Sphingomonas jatrophae]SFR82282.1 transcriptional regulator, LysR family [Sphingomonas jatrophae]